MLTPGLLAINIGTMLHKCTPGAMPQSFEASAKLLNKPTVLNKLPICFVAAATCPIMGGSEQCSWEGGWYASQAEEEVGGS